MPAKKTPISTVKPQHLTPKTPSLQERWVSLIITWLPTVGIDNPILWQEIWNIIQPQLRLNWKEDAATRKFLFERINCHKWHVQTITKLAFLLVFCILPDCGIIKSRLTSLLSKPIIFTPHIFCFSFSSPFLSFLLSSGPATYTPVGQSKLNHSKKTGKLQRANIKK